MPKNADLISSTLLLAFGLSLIFFVIPGQIALPDYEVTMSPRLLPYLCAGAISVLSINLIIQRLFKQDEALEADKKGFLSLEEAKALGGITGLFAICIGLFVYVAPVAAGAVLVIGLLALFGERNLVIYVAMTGALLVSTYLIFYQILGTAIG